MTLVVRNRSGAAVRTEERVKRMGCRPSNLYKFEDCILEEKRERHDRPVSDNYQRVRR